MKNTSKLILAVPFIVFLLAFINPSKKIKVYLIGDSTISIKDKSKYPETGWGMPFTWFFNSDIEVDNRALNGRSTQSFLNENRWNPVLDSLKPGDYVFIQFGHNDEVQTKKSATTPTQFVDNLTKYVKETRDKKANPILITPVARRKFNEQGKIEDTHKEYAQLVRETAKKLNVPLIDLSQKSMELLQNLGVDKSRMLYNHLEEGQNPNYPKGFTDDTHFNELGARYMAELVLKELKAQNHPLAKYSVEYSKK